MSHTSRSDFNGKLARREKRLAYSLLLPTFIQFWQSCCCRWWQILDFLKPVTLGDLRPPSLIIKEALRGATSSPGDIFKIEYRFRNSSIKYPLADASLRDTLPEGFLITLLDPACEIISGEGGRSIFCTLGDLDAKARGKLVIEAELEEPMLVNKDILKASKPETLFIAQNIMTSLEFTLENFKKVFSAAEFWNVLKASIYYTVFGTAGALLFGLIAAQIMLKTFPGRLLPLYYFRMSHQLSPSRFPGLCYSIHSPV